MVSLKDFKNSWKCLVATSTNDSFYPYSPDTLPPDNKTMDALSDVPKGIDNIEHWLTQSGQFTYYNAPISQDYDDHQYSYEKGYYYAFKAVMFHAWSDSESYLMPATFLARQYTELCLKDSIFNISLATGADIPIGSTQDHCLLKLGSSFHKLLDDTDLNILKPMFFDIINAMSSLSPKSDEFRFTTGINGDYNFPIEPVRANIQGKQSNDNGGLTSVNLINLAQCINYLALFFGSLYYLLYEDDNSPSMKSPVFNPYFSGLISSISRSSFYKDCNKYVNDYSYRSMVAKRIKKEISAIINRNGLKYLDPKNIKVDVCDKSYRVLYHIQGEDSIRNAKLFDIYNDDDQTWFMKTPSLFTKN